MYAIEAEAFKAKTRIRDNLSEHTRSTISAADEGHIACVIADAAARCVAATLQAMSEMTDEERARIVGLAKNGRSEELDEAVRVLLRSSPFGNL